MLKTPECKMYIQYSENFQGKLCFSGQAQLAQKSLMIKNTYSIHWKFQGNSVFQGKRNLLKTPENKKYIFSTVNLGHPLLFRASATCSKILNDKKYIFNTVKIPGQLCFSVQAKLAQKSWMIKNTYSIQWKFQGKLCLSGQVLFAQKSWK